MRLYRETRAYAELREADPLAASGLDQQFHVVGLGIE
jgi:hypothetical protein